MSEQPPITADELAQFRRCRFVRRVFAPYASLRSVQPLGDGEGWHVSRPYHGEAFNPEEFELVEGGWDHEHCNLCGARIEGGDAYWPNEEKAGGHVDLCQKCYPHVMALLGGAEPGTTPDRRRD